ncbi:MAG: Rrf2 family transcriptional regulator [Acidimicrobiia bacterium]|nr:Rrf2 family transcriptional regulator [Acidimicrobiia bacterium]MBP8180908.1 Rrf2 family transcriptional regulator [Acidimicrobiia bacterium]
MRLTVTRRTDLAARALVVLSQEGRRMKAPELAKALQTTAGYLPQVLGPLIAAGWVQSDPGPTGGYQLDARLDDISVLDVVEAVEGPTNNSECVLIEGPCNQDVHCALHVPWSQARAVLCAQLAASPVSQLELSPARV